ncbi:MAG: alcohol dehydrogenase catalytic domain-containing protein [Clostridiales bacterium]|nr:alcohol dehydrogenase catalytic domain-containing protein [Clostridiales bacterium]
MKALKYHGPRNVEFIEIPKPTAGPGQVVVKVAYNGICGTDVHAYSMEGIFNWELILGHEAVGYVEELGEGVDYLKVGDRVAVGPPGDCGACYSCNTGNPNTCVNGFPNTLGIGPNTQGAYAEYVLSHYPKNELFKIPDGVAFEQAVLFDVLGVGYHAVRRSDFKVGDSAIVSGCGSIGLSVIQALKLAGANPLITFDPLASKRELALACGADYALDSTNPADIEKAKALCASTNGAVTCFEAAGHPASVQTCLDLVMPSGQVMMIGNDGRPFQLVTAAIGHHQTDMKFSFTYTKEEIAKLFSLISAGKLDTSAYSIQKAPLSEAIDKLEAIASGKLEVARVLLMPHGEI